MVFMEASRTNGDSERDCRSGGLSPVGLPADVFLFLQILSEVVGCLY